MYQVPSRATPSVFQEGDCASQNIANRKQTEDLVSVLYSSQDRE